MKNPYSLKDCSIIILVALVIGMLTNTKGIVEWAEQMPLGTQRALAYKLSLTLHEKTDAASLTGARQRIRNPAHGKGSASAR